MAFLFTCMRFVHIIGGFIALIILWVPILTRKGGKVHRRSGWIFVYSMSAVSATAWLMGVYRLTWNPGTDPDVIPFSWFLIFIAILSAATAWYGVRVLKYKKRKTPTRELSHLFFPILLLGSGVAMSLYGWFIHFPLLAYFPIVGIFLGGMQLQYWLSAPKRRSHWIVEHIIGMLSCSIATITAFTVFGAPNLLKIDSVSILLWFAPTIVLTPLIIGFTVFYTRKLDGKR